MKFLWALLTLVGILAIDSAFEYDGKWGWAVSFVGGFLVVFGLLHLTARHESR